ncbi:aminodeoxychorismate synthase component I [uncultured Arcticibacterium sp.]|uniref:aminodeoxychorismate synthase component I n=1 Tax=uncultured Arcticibacterium sp. TaxID=2173042 RepID=UPI0030F8FEA4
MQKRKKNIDVIEKMNEFGKSQTPFLFMVDFEMEAPMVIPLHALDSNRLIYAMNDNFVSYQNFNPINFENLEPLQIIKKPIGLKTFKKAFGQVLANLKKGNSFLTNLTAETEITSNWSLETLFHQCKSKYKLFVKGEFICFSPETFVQIGSSGKISSFPMKGTINAQIEKAEAIILADEKEKYEHTTIVDLIRNDLSSVANKVWVERFRYIDRIKRQDGSELLQVSSEVCGELGVNWRERVGEIIFKLLPAGSISGAPKPKTLEIIKEAERLTFKSEKRGFYTGVFGVFDGEKLDSAVMIRFIEQTSEGLVFKSGGGITSRSIAEKEYEELLSKIYVPIL